MSGVNRIRVVLWGVIAVICVAYAPLAIEYMWQYFDPAAPRLQHSLLNWVTSRDDFATGPGSVEAVRHADYASHRWLLLIHTTLGGLALLLAPFQFSARLRRYRPSLHRNLGKVALVAVTVSMLAGMLYLVKAPVVNHVGGLGFYVQLWMLDIGTLFSVVMAYTAIRARRVAQHQAWMALLMALLMTAPTLRMIWGIFGKLWPAADLLTTLGFGVTVTGYGVVSGAVIAVRWMDRSRPTREPVLRWAPSERELTVITAITVCVGLVSCVLVQAVTYPYFQPIAYLVFGYAGTLIAGHFAAAVRAARRGDQRRAQLWRMHTFALAAIPIAIGAGWLIISQILPADDAFITSGMLLAPLPVGLAFMLDVATSTAASRRRRAPSENPPTRATVPIG